MRNRHETGHERGSALLLVLILLGVLAVIAVSAVALSSQERTNAATKSRRDALAACASAAQATIWAELLKYGPRYLGSDASIGGSDGTGGTITLPDGTVLQVGHYDQGTAELLSKVVKPVACDSGQTEEFVDLTNRDSVLRLGGHCYQVVARCRIPRPWLTSSGLGSDLELEVEFGINTLF